MEPEATTPLFELTKRPSLLETTMYAAAMWEFQRLHFDHDWARREGLARAIVQGPLLGNYLVETLDMWMRGVLDLERLTWRHHAVVEVDEVLTCSGSVAPPTEDGRREAHLQIQDERGRTMVSATASLRSSAAGREPET